MTTALLVRVRFETYVSECLYKSSVAKALLLCLAISTVGCSDGFEDGSMIVPSADQEIAMSRQEEAMAGFYKEKKNAKVLISTSRKARSVRRIARAS